MHRNKISTLLSGILGFCLVISNAALKTPPRIIKQPTDEISLDGKPLTIECVADAEPAPTYHWIKDGTNFTLTNNDGRISQQPGRGTLDIKNLKDEDFGQYQCFAENERGVAASNSVFLRKAKLSVSTFQNNTVRVFEGNSFNSTCQIPDDFPKPKVTWSVKLNNGEKEVKNSRMTVDPDGTLWITQVKPTDNNTYVCSASSPFRNVTVLREEVLKVEDVNNVTREPFLQYVTTDAVALRGTTKELFCIFGGSPAPDVVWKKNGEQLDHMNLANYGRTLIIQNVKDEDAGNYTCKASNGQGKEQFHSVNLVVKSAPYFNEEPKRFNATEGDIVTFVCNVSGDPKPTIKWSHNGKPIDDAWFKLKQRSKTENSLTISNVTREDMGNYGCNATNEWGYAYEEGYANIFANTTITKAQENYEVLVGKNATIQCNAVADPSLNLKVVWKTTEGLIDLNSKPQQFNQSDHLSSDPKSSLRAINSSLTITNTTHQGLKTYTCVASTELGNNTIATVTLAIRAKTNITTVPENETVVAGKDAVFWCVAEADPPSSLTIHWERDGKPIELTDARFKTKNEAVSNSTNSSLTVTKTIFEEDSKKYTCVASTQLSSVNATANLSVSEPPDEGMGFGKKLLIVLLLFGVASLVYYVYRNHRTRIFWQLL